MQSNAVRKTSTSKFLVKSYVGLTELTGSIGRMPTMIGPAERRTAHQSPLPKEMR